MPERDLKTQMAHEFKFFEPLCARTYNFEPIAQSVMVLALRVAELPQQVESLTFEVKDRLDKLAPSNNPPTGQ